MKKEYMVVMTSEQYGLLPMKTNLTRKLMPAIPRVICVVVKLVNWNFL